MEYAGTREAQVVEAPETAARRPPVAQKTSMGPLCMRLAWRNSCAHASRERVSAILAIPG